MIKQFKEIFKITINSNQASATPPIGPMLGQRGINIIEFSKNFNNQTKEYKDGIPITTQIILNKNKTIKINLQKPTNSYLLKNILNIEKGSKETKHLIISSINISIIYEIVNFYYSNWSINNKINKCKSLISTAKSMGILTIK